jgi:lipoprotein-releasing system permease protein
MYTKGATFSRFISTISLIAIALSLVVMTVASSMINGFSNEISNKIFGFWGHIHIKSFSNNDSFDETPIIVTDSLIRELREKEYVRSAHVFAHKAGIMKSKYEMDGIFLKGVDEEYDWTFFNQYLLEGELLNLSDTAENRNVIVSKITAQRLSIRVGDAVIIYFLHKNSQKPLGRRFQVAGIYSTGLEEYDERFIMGDIRIIRELNGWESDRAGGVEVSVNDINYIQAANDDIYHHVVPNDVYTETIYDIYPNIFDWLKLQKSNEKIVFVLMMIVAILNMITALIILILDRVKMIGLLKSLGCSLSQLRQIFVYNGLFIILSGMIIGNVIGGIIVILQKKFGIIKLPEESYYVSVAPVDWVWSQILIINAIAVVITLLSLYLPATLVRKIEPVKALIFK